MDFLAGLNPQQQQAVRHLHGPLLILAGAGSGKTRVVTHRICHLIQQHNVRPESILAVTFTNKASGEMRERVHRLLAESGHFRAPAVSTFHSFCVRTLRRDGAPLDKLRPGFTPRFVIYDDDDQLSVIKQIYRHLAVDDKALPARQALSRISNAKNRHDGPEELLRQARDPSGKKLAQIYELYEDKLRQANALDFDDLLLETVRLLRSDEATRDAYNARFEHLMIDEYQDTNRSQYELMRLLSVHHSNVCVVGDEDQSIYSWRGADIRNILDFEKDYPNAVTIRLEQNYRSTKRILDAASTVIANNRERKGKTLWTDGAAGDKITVYQSFDAENEALYIADEIKKSLVYNPSERVAVLYRTNSQSRQMEEALRRNNIPYVVVGGTSFYQRAEIKDVMAYLKLSILPHDSISLMRVVNTPARGIGKSTMEQVEQYAVQNRKSIWEAIGDMLEKKLLPGRADAALAAFRRLVQDLHAVAATQPVSELLETILERTGYRRMLEQDKAVENESRLENLNELLNAAAEAVERGESASDFLDHAALVADSDQLDESARVSLLTVHNAKGLEWPVVFLAGLEEGLFPHSRSRDSESAMEEERRLCYVGMTRAQRKLTLSWARARRKFGGGPLEPAIRSRFLSEVPAEIVEKKGAADRPDFSASAGELNLGL
ncbi:MAG TPA: UvrD-helicase domain-containing protein, partial [Bryobacteraceae bacterium]|nr:UvrD-helicase domain-containing protein [Bryobacteraceae bacterium]